VTKPIIRIPVLVVLLEFARFAINEVA